MDLHEELIKKLEEEIKDLRELYKTNPELAKKKAREECGNDVYIKPENLQKTGIIDESGKLLPPYNGQKVNDNDFTIGPNENCLDNEEER